MHFSFSFHWRHDRNVEAPYDADIEVVEVFDGGGEEHEVRKAG
jgi:hypothetical protein